VEPGGTIGVVTTSGEAPKVGERLRCAKCGTEIIVTKAPSAPIRCCGEPMVPREATATTGAN
jgi:hypothetical protein